MSTALHNSIILQAKQIVLDTNKAGINFDPGIIHRLRTDFKKLRALLRWQRVEKKVYKCFKETYGRAGDIRNIQVAEEMLKKENFISAAFTDWLSDALEHLKKEWETAAAKETAKQLVHHIRGLKIGFSKHRKFFSRNIKNIQHAISGNAVSDTLIHDSRKMMKDIQYVLSWWKKKNDKHIKGIKNIHPKQLKELTEQVGAYNDRCMLIRFLKNYTSDKEISANQANMLAQWEEEKALSGVKLKSSIRKIK